MRIEVNSAADFVMNLLRVKKANPQLSEVQLQHFKGSLEQILTRHFARHWYPDVPTKGSGFRCLRINGKMDPIIERAGHAAGLNTVALRKMLPLELTIWIDPDEVSYRIGENGTICVLYDQQQSRASPSSDLDSTGSSSCDEFIMERVGRVDLSTSSSDSGTSVMVDFMDSNPSNSLVTQQSKHSKYNNNHHNNHHYAKRHNNSVSSSSSGQTSPPLSPPFNGYNNNYNNNRYQHNNSNQHSNYYSPSVHQQQQQYFHWDNQFVNNKVRTQC